MTQSFFVTGTDTNVGKTTATLALIKKYQEHGFKTLGLKPVASGCEYLNDILYNQDALLLQQASHLNPLYEDVNPFRFAAPVSPHVVNTSNISAQVIANTCQQTILKYNPDYCYIEGAGGWLCPLNNQESFADLALALQLPVILVVGIKLGCLNHAMLTIESIERSHLTIAGWVANYPQAPEMLTSYGLHDDYNLHYLQDKIKYPLLAQTPFTN